MNNNGNGYDPEKEEEDDDEKKRIIRFPSLAERDRMRREKEERKIIKTQKAANDVPFFNAGRIPLLTRIIIALFLVINIPLFLFVDAGTRLEIYYYFGFVPGHYTGAAQGTPLAFFAPLTYLFIHGGWMHLAFNTVMMLAMGMFTETTFGAKRMAIFFVVSGLSGAVLYLLLNPYSTAPVIGASGGISGLFGITFITLYQMGRLGPAGRYGIWPLVAFWIFLITGIGLVSGDIAWQAHLGGFLGGLGIYLAWRKKLVSF